MPSPFPGMDPYLERHWRDVHTSLVTLGRNALNQRLPDDLIARAEEGVAVEAGTPDTPSRRRREVSPDVRVFEEVHDERGGASAVGGGVALAPLRLVLQDEPTTERSIEIIDTRGGERLITVIEFVSPANKIGRGLESFVRKREELLDGGVSFVEIDLVRAGDWERLLHPHVCPPEARTAYRAVIRVPGNPSAAYLHPISLREPLPVLKIPLRPAEEPCDLPLQPLIVDAFRDGRYERTLDYRRPVESLDANDAAWADGLLRSAGKR